MSEFEARLVYTAGSRTGRATHRHTLSGKDNNNKKNQETWPLRSFNELYSGEKIYYSKTLPPFPKTINKSNILLNDFLTQTLM